MRVKDAVGRFGEDLAARHLRDSGLTVLARNWRCRSVELDIVAREGDTLAFVEVKTRSGTGFGHPAEAVTARKAERIHRLAMCWLAQNRGCEPHDAIRFDVVSVVRLAPGGPAVSHLRAAF
jgi:putative endonuclease